MANPLLEALSRTPLYSAKEDPFGVVAQTVGQSAPYLYNPYGSTGSNIATSLGSALFAGLMGGLAQNRTEERNKELFTSMKGLMNADADTLSAAVESNPRLGPLALALMGQKQESAAALQQKQLENELAIQKALKEEQLVGPVRAENEVTKQKSLIPLEVDKATRIKTAESEIASKAPLTPKQIADIELDATNKLTTGPQASRVLEIQRRGNDVMESLKVGDPIRAATAIYGFAKILDPDGVVRKEDGSIVANPGGPAGHLASLYNTIMQNGQLTEQTKKSMAEIVPQLVNNEYGAYTTMRESLIGGATAQGANAEKIKFLPKPQIGGMLGAEPTPNPISSGGAASPTPFASAPKNMTFAQFQEWKRSQGQ